MADQRRALLTEREREILTGEADVTDNYRYSVESRIRSRLRDNLARDVDVIREQYPEIFDELIYPAVCEPDPTTEPQPPVDTAEGGDERGTSAEPAGPPEPRTRDEETLPADIEEGLRRYLENRPPKSAHGKEIVVEAMKELRRNGPMKTAKLQEAVYPGYEEHYSGPRVLWNSVGRYLEDIPGFEKPEYGKWDYAGDKAAREGLQDA